MVARIKYAKLNHAMCKPVECAACGDKFHSLNNHLKSKHGLTSAEYRLKYNQTKKDINCDVTTKHRIALGHQFYKDGTVPLDRVRVKAQQARKKWYTDNPELSKAVATKSSHMGAEARAEYFARPEVKKILAERITQASRDPKHKEAFRANSRRAGLHAAKTLPRKNGRYVKAVK